MWSVNLNGLSKLDGSFRYGGDMQGRRKYM
jgi:hypothetical protein